MEAIGVLLFLTMFAALPVGLMYLHGRIGKTGATSEELMRARWEARYHREENDIILSVAKQIKSHTAQRVAAVFADSNYIDYLIARQMGLPNVQNVQNTPAEPEREPFRVLRGQGQTIPAGDYPPHRREYTEYETYTSRKTARHYEPFSADEMRGAMEDAFHVRGNGAMLFADMLADTADGVLVVNKDWRGVLGAQLLADGGGSSGMDLPYMERDYPDAVFVRPDSPAAVPALQKLAKREADLVAQHNGRLPEHLSMLKRFPQMAEFMPEVKMRFTLNDRTAMKPPYFVRCLSEALLDALSERAPFAALAAQQAFLNVETKGYGNVFGYGEIIVDDDSVFDRDRTTDLPMVLDSLKAHGVKAASASDLAVLAGKTTDFAVMEYFAGHDSTRSAREQIIALVDDVQNDWKTVAAAIRQMYADALAPYCTDGFQDDGLNRNLGGIEFFKALRKRFDDARYVPSDYVYLSGQTYDFAMKLDNKTGLRKVLEAQDFEVAFVGRDGSCRWDSDKAFFKEAGSPQNVRNAWLLSRKAWEFLQESHAGAVDKYGISAHDAK